MANQTIKNRVAELMSKKARREGRKINQKIVAAETGIDYQTVGRWYRNEVTRWDNDMIFTWMNYFDCTFDELLIVQEEPDSSDKPGQYETHLLAG